MALVQAKMSDDTAIKRQQKVIAINFFIFQPILYSLFSICDKWVPAKRQYIGRIKPNSLQILKLLK
jgi:hypothetical protein